MSAAKFATGASLDQSKSYFAAMTQEGELPSVQSVGRPPEPNERWEVVSECNASSVINSGGWFNKKTTTLAPKLLAWSPDGTQVAISCDINGILLWRTGGQQLQHFHNYSEDAIQGYTKGAIEKAWPNWIFWSADSSLILVLSSISVMSIIGTVHLGNNSVGFWEADSRLDILADVMDYYDDRRTSTFSPWRPGTQEIMRIPRPRRSLQLVNLGSLSSSNRNLDLFPVRAIGFDSILSPGHEAKRFDWHPSGKYVAVTVGEGLDSFQTLIVRTDDGEIVASTPSPTLSLGWSPGGRLLLLRMRDGTPIIWDAQTFNVRPLSNAEKATRWAQRILDHQPDYQIRRGATHLPNADRSRVMERDSTSQGTILVRSIATRAVCKRLEATHAAWSPTDPYCFASIGGSDAPNALRVWRLKV